MMQENEEMSLQKLFCYDRIPEVRQLNREKVYFCIGFRVSAHDWLTPLLQVYSAAGCHSRNTWWDTLLYFTVTKRGVGRRQARVPKFPSRATPQ